MATLVLVPIAAYASAAAVDAAGVAAGTVASSIITAGVTGAFLAAGSYIDAMYVMPALFGRGAGNIQGPKLSDIQLTTGTPGSPINVCFGRQNRTSGTVIWMSPIKQVAHDNGLGGKGGGNVISYEYYVSIAIAWCEGTSNAVRRIWADGLLIYDNGQIDQRYDQVAHYLGTQTAADPTIQAVEGIPNTPAFVNMTYSVITNLALHDWGNRVPNLTALIEQKEQTLLSDVIESIWSRAGRDTSEIDTSWIRDVEVLGYTISGVQSAQAILQPLTMAFDLVAQEQDGIIHFYHRKDMTPVNLSSALFAAQEESKSDSAERAISITDQPSFDVPQEVDVTYLDANTFWQQNNQRVSKFSHPSPVSLQVQLPMVLDSNVARGIAQRVLWGAQVERKSFQFTLPPSQCHLLESDLLAFTVDNFSFVARINSITRGTNYLQEVQATAEQTSILTQAATADIPVIDPQPGPVGFQTHNLVIMEIPILNYESYQRGFHYAVFPSAFGDTWKGGRLFNSLNNITFTEMDTYHVPGTGGVCQTILPDGTNSKTAMWDLVTTLNVQMLSGSLQSVDERTVLSGTNHLYVGKGDGTGEVIAFCNAVLVSSNTYQISKILRGRMGTEDRMTGHAVGDYAVLLDQGNGVKFYPGSENIGKTIYFKAVPNNVKQETMTAISEVRSYRVVWPWAPTKVIGVRDGSNNLTLTWQRRSNKWFDIFGDGTSYNNLADKAPQPFASELYNIYVYNISGTLKKVYSGVTSPFVYSAANQTADGLTPGSALKISIAQVNINLEIRGGEGVMSDTYTI